MCADIRLQIALKSAAIWSLTYEYFESKENIEVFTEFLQTKHFVEI